MRQGTNIIHFPNRKGATLDEEFETLLDDMGGFVIHLKKVTGYSWEKLGEVCDLDGSTLKKVARREYKSGPMGRTFYKILRALDNRAVIKHSMFNKYSHLTRADAKRLDRAVAAR